MAMPVMFDPSATAAAAMSEAELLRIRQENEALQTRLQQMRNVVLIYNCANLK